MTVKLNLGAKGRIKATLTDVRDGSKQVIEQDNLLLNGIFNRWFTQNISLLSANTLNTCFLGTGNTPPTPADTGLSGGTLASSSAGRNVYVEDSFAEYEVNIAWPAGKILYATFNHDDSIFVVLSDEAPFITFYDAQNDFSKMSLSVPNIPNVPVWCAFSNDGNYLAVNHLGSPALCLYDIPDGFSRIDISPEEVVGHAYDNCYFSPDSKLLTVIHYSTGHYLYDIVNNHTVLWTDNRTDYIMSKFSPDGSVLVSSYGSRTKDSTGYCRLRRKDGGGNFSHEDYIATATGTRAMYFDFFYTKPWMVLTGQSGKWQYANRYLTVYDYENNETVYSQTSYDGLGGVVAVHPINEWVIYRWDGTHIRIDPTQTTQLNNAHGYFPTWSSWLTAIAVFSHDGRYMLIGTDSATCTLFDLLPPNPKSRKYARAWTFPAGTGTGTVSELYLRASSSSPYSSTPVARVVLDSPIHKTEFHQLDVEWTIELKCDPVVSTYIENGQVDGTPVDCRFELLHMMFHGLCTENIHTSWFGITGTPRLRLGDSNAETNKFFKFGIQGEEFANFNTANIRIPSPYVPDSLERTVRIFLEVDQGNEQPIAEMVMERFARLTFDPPLEKNDSNRLYVDVTFKWERG